MILQRGGYEVCSEGSRRSHWPIADRSEFQTVGGLITERRMTISSFEIFPRNFQWLLLTGSQGARGLVDEERYGGNKSSK